MKFTAWSSRMPAIPASALVVVAAGHAAHAQNRFVPAAAPAEVIEGSVTSEDGTTIAYEQSGTGPALILVAPALSSRAGGARLAELLAPSFTVINFDRRGRGESGDSVPYAVEREVEDIEALVERAGGSAFLFGSSSGAVLALEAANTLTTRVRAVVLFEPPFIVDDSRPPIPDGLFERIGSMASAGRRSDAVAAFMHEGIGVPEELLGTMKQAPMWAGMEKLAHTLPYDGALLSGLQAGKPLPAGRWTSVTARTLVVDGEQSDAFLRNAVAALTEVLPGSKRHTLQGQDHSAPFTAPQTLVPVLVSFFAAEGRPVGIRFRASGLRGVGMTGESAAGGT